MIYKHSETTDKTVIDKSAKSGKQVILTGSLLKFIYFLLRFVCVALSSVYRSASFEYLFLTNSYILPVCTLCIEGVSLFVFSALSISRNILFLYFKRF